MDLEHMQSQGQAALHWGQEHYPDASPHHHAAFANSVYYALFRMTGPYSGPSLREHVACALLNSALEAWDGAPLSEVCLFLASSVYGRLTEEHLRFWLKYRDICHCDDPEDVRVLTAHSEQYKFATTRVWSATLDNMRRVAALREETMVSALDRIAKEELARISQCGPAQQHPLRELPPQQAGGLQ